MSRYHSPIESDTLRNTDYRRVVYTDKQMQIVYMSLNPGEYIPEEVHAHTSQFIRVEKGKARVFIEDVPHLMYEDIAIVIPSGKRHKVENIGRYPLKLYTIYSPPEHPVGTVEKRQKEF